MYTQHGKGGGFNEKSNNNNDNFLTTERQFEVRLTCLLGAFNIGKMLNLMHIACFLCLF